MDLMKKFLIIMASALLLRMNASAQQACTNLGQTPASAFPVCGTSVFSQTTVPACVNHIIPTNCPDDGNVYQDLNPYWYKFTCFQSGTLGFLIQPNNQQDDYDWQLFDITGHDPSDVYSNPSLLVAYDWSGEVGNTGASNSGNSLFVCGTTPTSPYRPLFTTMPMLIQGHQYLLLISHFLGDQQSGYQLSFGGGTASITDTTAPALRQAVTNCDATQIRVRLNKKMKCASLSANGSDFSLSPAPVSIVGAVGSGCSGSFDVDSVLLTLSGPLPVGNYTLTAVDGADGNTLLDNCGREIPVGDTLQFAILPLKPTPMDSLQPVACAPSGLQLVFSKPIRCNSIAANGSDFFVTGPSPVTVTGASGTCTSGTTPVINVVLSSPIVNGGIYQIHLQRGSDGNTLIDECGQETPVGSTLSFSLKDTVSASFTFQTRLGCRFDTVYYAHDGLHGVNQWLWTFDNSTVSSQQNPVQVYPATGQYQAQLIVSNGFCTDTASASLSLNNEVKARFTGPDILCPEDSAQFINQSTGPIDSWSWSFGNGQTSTLQDPPFQHYPLTGKETYYPIQLIISSPIGCQDTSTVSMRVLATCYIAVPSAFTPNGDGLNDYLYPLNALKADDLDFRVFNRWGQLVFATHDWQTKWDGTLNGLPQPAGVYVWTLRFTFHDTGKKVAMKGTTMLIR
ncbi:MAG TPA: gliding motility-associated C-terminal domain-containing protein [Chitinophagaceae bacterium]|nr:gliding motility-associated C-terminal domain-containing protein [Chitinophagaceae bacterium]